MDEMEQSKKSLLISIAIPLLTGTLSSFLTGGGMEMFGMTEKSSLSPPAWIFPVVWTILYTLMGISSYLIWRAEGNESEKERALRIYRLQLLVNFLWPTFFFNFRWYGFSLLWLVLLWILVLIMILRFGEISKVAAYLNIPYLIWLTFAAYLNFIVYSSAM